MSFRYQSLWILFILSKRRWISKSWPSWGETRIRPEFQLSGVMNGGSELFRDIRGPADLACMDAALHLFLRAIEVGRLCT